MYLIMNFITKLLLVAEKNAILVACNRLSKITHFAAITKEMLVEDLVRLFRDNVWKPYGLLESVIFDKILQLAVKLTKKLNKMLGIEIRLLTFFYLQTNR